MTLTLESIVDGKIKSEQLPIDPNSNLGQVVRQFGGWPEVIIKDGAPYVIQSFDPIDATYMAVTYCTL